MFKFNMEEEKPLGTSEDIKNLAMENIKKMIEEGESFKEVHPDARPGVSGSFFISKTPEKIIGGEVIEVSGEKFYIGLFKADSDK